MNEPRPEDKQKLNNFLTKWNWGAALLLWIWGLAHKKYALSALYFILSGLMPDNGWVTVGIFGSGIILFGVKGNRWAWKSKEWKSVDHFIKTQNMWSKCGIIITVGVILIFATLYFGLGGA